ncbi:unnamed protein product [Coccothraustes coccothraustes]
MRAGFAHRRLVLPGIWDGVPKYRYSCFRRQNRSELIWSVVKAGSTAEASSETLAPPNLPARLELPAGERTPRPAQRRRISERTVTHASSIPQAHRQRKAGIPG